MISSNIDVNCNLMILKEFQDQFSTAHISTRLIVTWILPRYKLIFECWQFRLFYPNLLAQTHTYLVAETLEDRNDLISRGLITDKMRSLATFCLVLVFSTLTHSLLFNYDRPRNEDDFGFYKPKVNPFLDMFFEPDPKVTPNPSDNLFAPELRILANRPNGLNHILKSGQQKNLKNQHLRFYRL